MFSRSQFKMYTHLSECGFHYGFQQKYVILSFLMRDNYILYSKTYSIGSHDIR